MEGRKRGKKEGGGKGHWTDLNNLFLPSSFPLSRDCV